MTRPASHAGTWYPVTKKEIASYIPSHAKKQNAFGLVCPHAGWAYSGKVTGEVFSRVNPASVYVLIGPNHRGLGAPVSVYPEGEWETPLGPLAIHDELAAAIIEAADGIAQPDTDAHEREHSLEVQMPFIKYTSPDAKIVPICLYDYRPETCKALGKAIATALMKLKLHKSAILVASTDMSHYVSEATAKKLDYHAIEHITDMDPAGLLSTVTANDISMCGSGPTASVMWACDELGALRATLVKYTTSGEATGDNSEVVGYAGLIIS